MSAISPSRLLTLFWSLALLFLVSFPASAADPTAATPADKPTNSTPADKPAKTTPAKEKSAKAKTAKSKSAKSKPAAATPTAVTEQEAYSAFDTFTAEWMNKLIKTEDFHRTQLIQVTQSPEGFRAEYVGYLPARSIWVKKTTYQETPFVGTLTYYERTLRCTGKTKEEALKGPFEQVETKPVAEIFRFTKGKWLY